jgi:tRNA-2-methylthio-N6-dimethylallyladenosine synthase
MLTVYIFFPSRSIIPDVAFTSDFIVGFCGETDEDFNATVSLVQAVGYHKCFMYSYSMR